jgi:hypothetical protein
VGAWLVARKTKRQRSERTRERAKINPHQFDDVLEEDDATDPQKPPAWNQRLFF